MKEMNLIAAIMMRNAREITTLPVHGGDAARINMIEKSLQQTRQLYRMMRLQSDVRMEYLAQIHALLIDFRQKCRDISFDELSDAQQGYTVMLEQVNEEQERNYNWRKLANEEQLAVEKVEAILSEYYGRKDELRKLYTKATKEEPTKRMTSRELAEAIVYS